LVLFFNIFYLIWYITRTEDRCPVCNKNVYVKKGSHHGVKGLSGTLTHMRGTQATDYEWHDVPDHGLPQWAKEEELKLGKVLKGKSFLYRYDSQSHKFQKRLRKSD
jgi:hypothetical protein